MTKAQKVPKYIILSIVTLCLVLLTYFGYKKITRKEILASKLEFKFSSKNYRLKLYSDSTYYLVESYPYNPDTITNIKGEYYLKKDTIYFKDSINQFKSNKAVIKNNILEFISNDYYPRLLITQTSLELNPKIDFKKHTDFAVFTYQHKFDQYYLKGQPYDLTEKDIEEIIEIFNSCPIERGVLQSSNYWKQCVAVINPKGEKEVWLNCSCGPHDMFQYGLIQTMDGGPCYMRMKINLTTQSCYDIHFNGY